MSTSLKSEINRLNSLPANEAEGELLKCCGSKRWGQLMAAARPFATFDELSTKADQIWWALGASDWLEAFRSHPRIGEKKAAQQVSRESQAWSAQEQSGVESSPADTLDALTELNQAYEEKFGFIFIVCASGKSSDEMLATLRARLENPADVELRNAAAEQAKITQLRLEKLMAGAS